MTFCTCWCCYMTWSRCTTRKCTVRWCFEWCRYAIRGVCWQNVTENAAPSTCGLLRNDAAPSARLVTLGRRWNFGGHQCININVNVVVRCIIHPLGLTQTCFQSALLQPLPVDAMYLRHGFFDVRLFPSDIILRWQYRILCSIISGKNEFG